MATSDDMSPDNLLKPNKRNGHVLEPLNNQLTENSRNLSVPRMMDANVNIHPIIVAPTSTQARGGAKALGAINHDNHKIISENQSNTDVKPPIKGAKFRTLEPIHK